jgi:hypothetical protein
VGLLVLIAMFLTMVDARPYSRGASLSAALAKMAAASMRASAYETSELDRAAAKIAAEFAHTNCCRCEIVSCFVGPCCL